MSETDPINYNQMTSDTVEDAIRKLCLMIKLTRMTPSPTLSQIDEFMATAEQEIRGVLDAVIREREAAAKREERARIAGVADGEGMHIISSWIRGPKVDALDDKEAHRG